MISIEAVNLHVKGLVQGVGFRPFVYREAKKRRITGWVLNAIDGVHIHAEGDGDELDRFTLAVADEAPVAAHVSEVNIEECPVEGFEDFEIRFSDASESEQSTLVSPDIATCAECEAELFDPENRRYRYPFINCTNCGPRFTIVDHLPYDRKATSMATFEMCPECAAEYADPADRRFHAQPDACFECGPSLSFRVLREGACDGITCDRVTRDGGSCDGAERDGVVCDEVMGDGVTCGGDTCGGVDVSLGKTTWGGSRETSDAIISLTVAMLRAGKIVAIKGLGGFHLACDADNPAAVAALRQRKHRDGKAFAVMVASADDAKSVCLVSDEEQNHLESARRPIVLLRKKKNAEIGAGVADGLTELGIMLPSTPLQLLIMHDFAKAGGRMLVMTSGNLHDEPIVIDDEAAVAKLGSIADAMVGNNRPILSRFDDSVVRLIHAGKAGEFLQVIRRARGFAPSPIVVPGKEGPAGPVVLATGPEQKSTLTLLEGCRAFVSQHIGDLEDADTYDAWLEAKNRTERLFGAKPAVIAADMHPSYLSTQWTDGQDLPVTKVQHHHAHVVAVLAENGIENAACGISFDGTGFGVDGAVWGGEVLLSNQADYERFANFVYLPMPGGAAAIKNPLRMAYGMLWAFDLLEHEGARGVLERLGDAADMLGQMIEKEVNTPQTSSVGRLFDAVSALLGVCVSPSYQGEGAVLLEAAAATAEGDLGEREAAQQRYAVDVIKNTASGKSTAHDTSVVLFDAAPTIRAILDDMVGGVPVNEIAYRFHEAMVGVIVQSATLVDAVYGIKTVALSGGVFMNRFLMEHAVEELYERGFVVAVSRELPPNDGSVSFGQAVVVWRREIQGV